MGQQQTPNKQQQNHPLRKELNPLGAQINFIGQIFTLDCCCKTQH